MNPILSTHRGDVVYATQAVADTLGRTFEGATVVVAPDATPTQVIVHDRVVGVRIKRAILKRLRSEFVAVSERRSRAL